MYVKQMKWLINWWSFLFLAGKAKSGLLSVPVVDLFHNNIKKLLYLSLFPSLSIWNLIKIINYNLKISYFATKLGMLGPIQNEGGGNPGARVTLARGLP